MYMQNTLYGICIYLLLNAYVMQNRMKEMKGNYVDITTEVSVEKFNMIAAAILKDGDRRPYCNKYNNSPHLKLDSFDVYLNPVSQFTNWSADKLSAEVSDYNVLVIQDNSSDIIYYHIILKDHAVVLDGDEPGRIEIIRQNFIHTYLPAIEKTFHLTASNN